MSTKNKFRFVSFETYFLLIFIPLYVSLVNCSSVIGILSLVWRTGWTLRTDVEQDRRQLNAVKLVMTVFEPKPDLLMVVSPAELVFGNEFFDVLGPYREEMGGESSECAACDKTWPGEGFQCSDRLLVFCAKSLPDPKPLPSIQTSRCPPPNHVCRGGQKPLRRYPCNCRC